MTCKEWREGYSQGFSDGYEKARHDLTDTKPVTTPTWDPPSCRVCGMKWDRPMGYVCQHEKCPSRITCGNANHFLSAFTIADRTTK